MLFGQELVTGLANRQCYIHKSNNVYLQGKLLNKQAVFTSQCSLLALTSWQKVSHC